MTYARPMTTSRYFLPVRNFLGCIQTTGADSASCRIEMQRYYDGESHNSNSLPSRVVVLDCLIWFPRNYTCSGSFPLPRAAQLSGSLFLLLRPDLPGPAVWKQELHVRMSLGGFAVNMNSLNTNTVDHNVDLSQSFWKSPRVSSSCSLSATSPQSQRSILVPLPEASTDHHVSSSVRGGFNSVEKYQSNGTTSKIQVKRKDV